MNPAPTSAPSPAVREPELPFSTRSAASFYASLIRRYRRSLAAMGLCLALFAVLSAGRIAAIGLVLDAVTLHHQAATAPAGSGGDPSPGGPGPGAGAPPGTGGPALPGADRAGDGTAVHAFESAWTSLLPADVPPPTRQLGSVEGFWRFLIALVIAMGAASLLLGLAFFAKETIAVSMVARMLVDARKALFDHLTRQSVSYFHDRRAGDLTSRVTNDVEIVQSSLHHLFQTLLQQPLIVLSGLAVALWASPFLFALSMPLLGLMIVPVSRAGRRVIHHGRRRQRKLGVITEALQQLFGGIRIVKAFGMEPHEREQFHRKNRAFGRSFRKTLQAKITGRSLQEILYNTGVTLLLLLGAWLIIDGDLSVGKFSSFILAMVQVYTPMKAASKAWNKVQESRAGVERVLELLREEPVQRDRPGARPFPGLHREIRFDNVHFSYREGPHPGPAPAATTEHAAVTGIDLRVRKGEAVALVGPSGAGKSTLVDLLARFYDPQRGRILVDGTDLREYTHASWLQSIAIVSQDPFLFHTTIRENIRYGREDATDQEIEDAARAACAHDFILDQPEGYDTEIGDRGAKLSGGQRQRITIARALLKNAAILILDEATSALDSEAERVVQKAIDALMHERTTFVIAHRLSTVTGADRIVVLDQGRIVETGRHEELLERKGRYRELWLHQNGAGAADGRGRSEGEGRAGAAQPGDRPQAGAVPSARYPEAPPGGASPPAPAEDSAPPGGLDGR